MAVALARRDPAPAASADAVVCERVTVRFTTERGTVTALENIDLSIPRGSFLTLLGPSGCGKSTLLRVMADLIEPTSGRIEVLGDVPATARQNREIGFVFQAANLLARATALQNVELPLVYGKVPAHERRSRVEAVLEKMDIAHRSDHFPAQLSGGQQQRVAVARALVNKPNLILADEPTGNLDSEHGDEVMKMLLRLNEEGTSILMVTHSAANAAFSNRIVNLLDGKVVSDKSVGR
jgi:ABC-type lipoprotein export system ATPase subunit